jgi:signal transduction histidine kinase
MDRNRNSRCSDNLASLVHDLRQPLSNIALSASYIELLLGPDQARIREQISIIQQQVDRASVALERALSPQQEDGRVEPSETILLRNAQTAADA